MCVCFFFVAVSSCMFFGAFHVQHVRIIIALVPSILLLLPKAFEVNWDLSVRVPLPVPTPRLTGGVWSM